MLVKTILYKIKRYYFLHLKKFSGNRNTYDYILCPGKALSIKGIKEFNEDVFCYINNLLTLKSGSINISSPCQEIRLINGKSLKIGIETWISQELFLSYISATTERPLFKNDNEYIFWKEGFLYRKNEKGVIKLVKHDLRDILYAEMILCSGWYVLRSGGLIEISKDFIEWKVIYDGKRGIKDSMVFLDNINSLLFIEYTPGAIRERHNILKYDFSLEKLEVIKIFYTLSEYKEKGLSPCARHIHLIAKDPFTDDIYVSTGDYFEECGIHVSKDGGKSFNTVFFGSQEYRALSFFFTKDSVYWNTDTHESQALIRMDRKTKEMSKYPLLNGALWCSIRYSNSFLKNDFYIMSSNSEGALYDNYNRVYGVYLANEEPEFFELYKQRSRTQYSQLFVLGPNYDNEVAFYDTDKKVIELYSVNKL